MQALESFRRVWNVIQARGFSAKLFAVGRIVICRILSKRLQEIVRTFGALQGKYSLWTYLGALLVLVGLMLAATGLVAPKANAAAGGKFLTTATIEFDSNVAGAGTVTFVVDEFWGTANDDGIEFATFLSIEGVATHDPVSFLEGATKSERMVEAWCFTGNDMPQKACPYLETILTKSFHFTGATPGNAVQVWENYYAQYDGYDRALLAEGIAPFIDGEATDGDADGDGVLDSKDLCPATPKGSPVNADGCVDSLSAVAVLEKTAEAPAAGGNGSATFAVTNPNQVDATYEISVDGKKVADLAVPAGKTVPLTIDRPAGDYTVSLVDAKAPRTSLPFTIPAKATEGTKDPAPTKDPTPAPTKDPTPAPTTKPATAPTTKPATVPTTKPPTTPKATASEAATGTAVSTNNGGTAGLAATGSQSATIGGIAGGMLLIAGLALVLVRPGRQRLSK